MFNIDILKETLPKIAFKSQAVKGQGGALRHFMFGGAPIFGSADNGLIIGDYRRVGISASKEATFGADPNRITYKTGFNSMALNPAYFNDRDILDFNNASGRHYGEDMNGVSPEQRVALDLADKRDALIEAQNLAIEKMCADVLLTGKVGVGVNGDKIQTFPMVASLLKVSGANLFTDPMTTLSNAVKSVYKENKTSRLKTLIMNTSDAIKFVTACEKWIDKNTFAQGGMNFSEYDEYGLVFDGRINVPGAGMVEIYHYLADFNGVDFIPQGKCLFVPQMIGAMGYGRVMSADNNLGLGVPVVAESRVNITAEGAGDYKKLVITRQTSPLPIIQNVDGYCVLTGIPA